MLSAVDLGLIVVTPALIAASGLCSAAETVLFSLTHSDRVRLRKLSPTAARHVTDLLAHPRRSLIQILILNIAVNSLYFVITSVLARRLGVGPLAVGVGAVSVLALTLLGEVVPKSLSTVHRVSFARAIGPGLFAVGKIIGPACGAIDRWVVRPLSLIARAPGAGEAPSISVDELSSLLEAGASTGAIAEDEERLLTDAVQLGTLRVKDVMTPRVRIAWLDERASRDDVAALVRRTGHTKFPVCRGGLDGRILGLLNSKDMLAAIAAGKMPKGMQAGGPAVPVPFVPDRARLDQLLALFGSTGSHVALGVDEFGAVTGLVEVEDVVKQLARPDEDIAAERSGVERQAPGHWTVPGRLGIRQWAQFFEADPAHRGHDSEASTVAGLILCRLGRLPQVGDEITVGNLTLRVRAMHGRVIERVDVIVRSHAA